ncbi:hypothetical protein [Nesterenkonia jeotgali]|uniref:Uncharacterized protein n=1 Tax=Nesterenkonia jeotgali TaxID=317018 RepID=A0A0W8ICT9_9MICC|nr:hypothetical protein [Nesterenkonia jeotgali]KUG57770.1 hypothetical protein AVL63_04405 [Nesterenkonia jeotgali]
MDPISELLAEAKAAATALAGMPTPDKWRWATVTSAYPDEYRVRFDAQTTEHPVIAPEPCRPGDRVLCARMGRQTIISKVITRAWRYPTLLNGWDKGDGSHRELAYRRQGDLVFWRGVVYGGAGVNAICTVDQDCRPIDGLAAMNGGWGTENRNIRVAADGNVLLSNSSYSSSWTSFDGAYYSVV